MLAEVGTEYVLDNDAEDSNCGVLTDDVSDFRPSLRQYKEDANPAIIHETISTRKGNGTIARAIGIHDGIRN